MTTVRDAVRAAIPEASDSLVEYIMWERTPYPIGKSTARTIYRAASAYKRATDNGMQLCMFCHRVAREGKWECQVCRDALDRINREGE